MKVKKSKESKVSPKKGHGSLYIGITVLAVLCFLFFLWLNYFSKSQQASETEGTLPKSLVQDISVPHSTENNKTDATQVNRQVTEEPESLTGKENIPSLFPPNNSLTVDNPPIPLSSANNPPIPLKSDGADAQDKSALQSDQTNTDKASPLLPLSDKCEKSAQTVKDFYAHLDKAPYMKDYNLDSRSEEYFTTLIQNLLDNPPIVSGETTDLFTILQNTAHFFRIIGKDNILVLKGIIDMEKDKFEAVLADFYSVIHIPGCVENKLSLKIDDSSLYDYAGFFLNTMGGRLYLFRRDSLSRIVVSYYAVLLIDHATMLHCSTCFNQSH